jgi:hypothetical protein
MRAAQPSWAAVTGTEAQKLTGWTTVANSKKKTKKHPLDQRRILFVRNVQSHDRDPRDIMFEVNKALANARAHLTVRLIKTGYTEKGNLTDEMGENACAEDLFAPAQAVMAVVQKLDPEVVYMDETEKCARNHANTLLRSALTVRDHIKQHRKGALKGEPPGELVCQSKMRCAVARPGWRWRWRWRWSRTACQSQTAK